MNVFDIIGPVMIGPSSSHTAGAVRIGRVANKLAQGRIPDRVEITLSSADMALAGVSPKIPVDECLDAMKEVGDALPASLKETAGGGLAATPTGRRLQEQVFGKNI